MRLTRTEFHRRTRWMGIAAVFWGTFLGANAAGADAGDTLYSSSLWTKKTSKTTGLYTIEQRGDDRFLRLSSDFQTKSAPDLQIVLSPHAPEQATSKNALDGGVVVSPLKSTSGAQEYPIDPSVDLDGFRSVLIHCEQYTKLWSAAPLHEGRVIARGDTWKKKTKKTTGAFEIAEGPAGMVIRFADDFKTAKAPEPLRIVISPHTIRSASNKNALEGGQIVGLMSRYKGGQTHELPEGFELRAGATLLLHCEKYAKLWSAATIEFVDE